MTMRSCRECGRAISSKAITCPGCGNKLRKSAADNIGQLLGGLVMMAIGMTMLFVLGL